MAYWHKTARGAIVGLLALASVMIIGWLSVVIADDLLTREAEFALSKVWTGHRVWLLEL